MSCLSVLKRLYKIVAMLIGSIVVFLGMLGVSFAGYILVSEKIQEFKTRRQWKND